LVEPFRGVLPVACLFLHPRKEGEVMPLKWGSPQVEVETLDDHNRRALDGIEREHYATLAVLAVSALGWLIGFAALIVAVIR
jgi:hypothetical protein